MSSPCFWEVAGHKWLEVDEVWGARQIPCANKFVCWEGWRRKRNFPSKVLHKNWSATWTLFHASVLGGWSQDARWDLHHIEWLQPWRLHLEHNYTKWCCAGSSSSHPQPKSLHTDLQSRGTTTGLKWLHIHAVHLRFSGPIAQDACYTGFLAGVYLCNSRARIASATALLCKQALHAKSSSIILVIATTHKRYTIKIFPGICVTILVLLANQTAGSELDLQGATKAEHADSSVLEKRRARQIYRKCSPGN